MLRGKNILIISPEPWEHVHVSKHHYAVELAERFNRVYFLNPPSHSRLDILAVAKNIYQINYKGFVKGLSYLPSIIRKNEQRKAYKKIEELAQERFDIVWSFDNSVFYDLDALPSDVTTISHIVDIGQNFQMERASQSADICLGVTQKIIQRHKKYNKRSFHIPHGVHIYPSNKVINLPGENSLKALYFGNLAMPHINWELLNTAVAQYVQIDFILLGPNKDPEKVVNSQNLIFIDPVDSVALQSYMQASDLLLLFYTPVYLAHYASPHKMLEYLSSGKPIISNVFPDYQDYDELIYQSDDNDQWLQNLSMALKESKDKSKLRRELAEANTYGQRIQEIEKILSDVNE